MTYTRIFHRLFDMPCRECREVKVLFWRARCSFCDVAEGRVN
jgi:hypothetical protein